MATKYEYHICVRGRNAFPVDMLRYDRCTPLHESDSDVIHRSIMREAGLYTGAEGNRLGVTVAVRSDKPPTEARWRSFSWEVVSVDKIRSFA
jgi:hypothetical protein